MDARDFQFGSRHGRSGRIGPLVAALRDRIGVWFDQRWSDPGRRRSLLRTTIIVGVLALGSGGVGLYLWFRPRPEPDYLKADMDAVFDFTLLSDEFNDLPVERRIELIGQLLKRIDSMGSQDSALLAAFAAGISGSMRERIEKNISRVVIDLWDTYATRYDDVPDEDRGAFLDASFVEMMRMMERAGQDDWKASDADILQWGKRQAQEDLDMLADPQSRPSGRQMTQMFRIVRFGLGSHASSQQRARSGLLLRDMTRRLRGRDIHTGRKPG